MSTWPTALPTPKIAPLMETPALRWGVAGAGQIGADFTNAAHRFTSQRVVAVAARDHERAAAFASANNVPVSYASYDALVGDPSVDIVYVSTIHPHHEAVALLAIEAGKHVLVEKPMAPTAAGVRRIADAARAAGVFAMEAMWTRFLPQTSVIAQLLDDGVLGELIEVSADLGFHFDPRDVPRAFEPHLGGGALLDVGIYPIWLSHFLLGAPTSVTARGSLTDQGVDANSALVLEYDSRAIATLRSSFWADTDGTPEIAGRNARIVFDEMFIHPGSFDVIAPNHLLRFTDDSPIRGRDALAYEAAAVAGHIHAGRTEAPEHPLSTSIEIMEIIDEALRQLGATTVGRE